MLDYRSNQYKYYAHVHYVHSSLEYTITCYVYLIPVSILDGLKCSFTDSDGCNHFFYVQRTIILVENDRGIQYHTNTHVYHYRIILYTFHTHTQSCVYISNDALLILHVFLYLFRMSKYKW